MRHKTWKALGILLLGSLLLRSGIEWTPPFSEANSRDSISIQLELDRIEPLASRASANDDAHPDFAQPGLRKSPTRRASDSIASVDDPDMAMHPDLESEPDSGNLDFATEREILEVLSQAVEQQQQSRELFISPGIVGAVASGDRVRIIFEVGSLSTDAQAFPLLGGPGGDAIFDSLRVFPLLERAAAEVGPTALLQLIENPETSHIEIDAVHRASLAETIPIVRADLSHQQGYDGDGFAVAILDTGVDTTHPMFATRLIEEACFSVLADCPNGQTEMLGPGAAVPCAMSGCGHGTRVAGIAVGDESGGSLVGTAPRANLIAIQIFSDVDGELGAYSSDILAAMQHVLGLTTFHQIASVNLSLGGSQHTSEASCDLASASQLSAVSLLRAAGVLTIAAAGNDALTNAITTPGCLSNVVSVGSTSDSDVVSSFSNGASFLRMLAPGEFVTTSSTGGGVGVSSGTSMATPHVAGAIATIREAMPTATPDEIENALVLSGMPILDSRNGVTTPRLQVEDTILLLASAEPPPISPPPAEGSSGGGGGGSVASPSSSGGGGGACGLVGIEPFLIVGLVRLCRPRRSRFSRFSRFSRNVRRRD